MLLETDEGGLVNTDRCFAIHITGDGNTSAITAYESLSPGSYSNIPLTPHMSADDATDALLKLKKAIRERAQKGDPIVPYIDYGKAN